ncbi:DUF2867 domain-containing protein [Rhodococcoides yunnanense]|uniref:DUF2867 domain-containing protein n=1 Tax=Rhodococcoides yunnanense TaxID=278209 RepID=UPI0009331879|nr:DUF2867 domain-containing protein [Rhodococcus yunnanensis]
MVAYADRHEIRVPAGWTAIDFAGQVLGRAPRWLTGLVDLRDKIVSRFGFATQPGRSRTPDIAVGGTAGPFIFSDVTSAAVRGGNSDSRIVFGSTFRIDKRAGLSYGVLETETHSKDRVGAVYLTLIWPVHRLLMAGVLRSSMSDVHWDASKAPLSQSPRHN